MPKYPSIRYYAATEQLERKDNQDFYFADERSRLYLVADGMGGLEGGAIASRFASHLAQRLIDAVDDTLSHNPRNDDYEKILQAAVKEIHDNIVAETDRLAFDRMGCTLVLILFRGSKCYVLNAGDSPCYLYNEETLRQITRSHSKVDQMLREGEITKEEAKVHPKRNVVTRCLGGKKDLAFADIHVLPYYKNDRFFMCTDGVTKILSDQQIESFLKIKSPKEAIDQMMETIKVAPHELHPETQKPRSKDNATAMIVDVVSLIKKGQKKEESICSEKSEPSEVTMID